MADGARRNLRIGALAVVALLVLAVAILAVGSRQRIFTRHATYRTDFANVGGLQEGAAVRLNGLEVGYVESVDLSADPDQERIEVEFKVDSYYGPRIRTDAEVSIRTVGLLGDKYLEVRGGTSAGTRVAHRGLVPSTETAEMRELVAGGDDLMQNLLAISSSLRKVLRRVEEGEGVIGELTSAPTERADLADGIRATLTSLQIILRRVEDGHGLLGRFVGDESLADDLHASAHTLRLAAATVTRDFEGGDSAYAAVFRDRDNARRVDASLGSLADAASALAGVLQDLEKGDGTLPRLLHDGEYGEGFLDDLHGLTANLRSITGKIDEGEGTLGGLLNDPELLDDIENVVRGVQSSAILSWLIRDRRKAGERLEAEEIAQSAPGHGATTGAG